MSDIVKKTKNIVVEEAVVQATKLYTAEAMAWMLMNAFGFTIEDALDAIKRMVDAGGKGVVPMLACGAAAVQIRGNVTYGEDVLGLKDMSSKFVITGDRTTTGTKDKLNFGAMHITGHVICWLTGEGRKDGSLAQRMLMKGGDCIFGEYPKKTVAGEINAEIAKEHAEQSKNVLRRTMIDKKFAKETSSALFVVPAFSQIFAAVLAGNKVILPQSVMLKGLKVFPNTFDVHALNHDMTVATVTLETSEENRNVPEWKDKDEIAKAIYQNSKVVSDWSKPADAPVYIDDEMLPSGFKDGRSFLEFDSQTFSNKFQVVYKKALENVVVSPPDGEEEEHI